MKLPAAAGLALAASISLAACSGPPARPSPLQVLPDCGWRPNCVNSQSGRGVQAIEPLRANAEQWQNLKRWLAEQDDWAVVTDSGDFMQLVVRTPLMRFRDDVQLLFLPGENLIHVRSSSRLGFSDLGANAKRVQLLRSRLSRDHLHIQDE